METTVGHTTDRKIHIADSAQTLIGLCNTPLTATPDIFGALETIADRNRNIQRAADRIARVASMSDIAWDDMMTSTAEQVRVSDNPRNSVL